MRRFDYYFLANKGWYKHGEDGFGYFLTDKAPIEAIKSYRKYLRDSENFEKLTKGTISLDETPSKKDKLGKYYEREIESMSFADIKEAVDRIRKTIIEQGCNDELEIDNKMISIFGGMFIEEDISVNELNLLMGLVGKGYELPKEFLQLSTREQRDSFFEII